MDDVGHELGQPLGVQEVDVLKTMVLEVKQGAYEGGWGGGTELKC